MNVLIVMTKPSSDEPDKARAVHDIVHTASVSAAATTVQPVPLLDIMLITPIQIAMVQGVGRVHGYSLDKKSVLEILRTVRLSLVVQQTVLAAARLVPVLGTLVAISVAYALTYAVGEVSDYYFRSGRKTPADELRKRFTRIYKEKRKERVARYRKASSFKEDLDTLRKARSQHKISDEEFTQRRDEILRTSE